MDSDGASPSRSGSTTENGKELVFLFKKSSSSLENLTESNSQEEGATECPSTLHLAVPPSSSEYLLDSDSGGEPPALDPEGEGPPSIETQADLDDQGPPSLEAQAPDHFGRDDLENMGIANTWTEEDSLSSPPHLEYPIPLGTSAGGSSYGGGGDDEEMPTLESQLIVGDGGAAGVSLCASFNSPSHPSSHGEDGGGGSTMNLFSEGGSGMGEGSHAKGVLTSPTPGVCGLRNLGNTCFMAAGLQCLLNTPSLAEYFLDRPLSPELELATENLTTQFTLLLRKVWSGHFAMLQPSHFKQVLGTVHPQFKDYRQHDCQEFIALLLDSLHEQLNTAASPTKENLKSDPFSPQSEGEGSSSLETEEKVMDLDDIAAASSTRTSDLPEDTSAQVWSEKVASLSESSRSSQASSPRSSDSHLSLERGNGAYRLHSIPEDVKSGFQASADLEGEETRENNLLPPGSLRKMVSSGTGLEKNEMASQINSLGSHIKGLEDILKDAKTSNVNVQATDETVSNNELLFDSGKFLKTEVSRPQGTLENLNLASFHSFQDKEKAAGQKRIKETNLTQVNGSCEGSSSSMGTVDESKCYNNVKRMRLEDDGREGASWGEAATTGHTEGETRGGEVGGMEEEAMGEGRMEAGMDPVLLKEKLEADRHWAKHVAHNKSIVVETFQGQFKSTVVCSACQHVSVTYEPFMYLSVPLPRAMERQMCVMFVPASHDLQPVKYLVTLNREDKVRKLQEKLVSLVGLKEGCDIVVAEVLDNHIARTLNENLSLRHVNDTHRTIYAFEVKPPPLKSSGEGSSSTVAAECGSCDQVSSSTDADPLDLTPATLEEAQVTDSTSATSVTATTGDGRSDGWKSCAICLEEMADSELLRHASCSCLLCENCIEISCKHYGGDTLQCPVCSLSVKPKEEFVKLDKIKHMKPKIRTLHVSVVFRLDIEGDGNNNQKDMKLFGHPALLCLPSQLPAITFYQVLKKHLPYVEAYDVLLVDGQGLHCSRCMYTSHCRGCQVPSTGEVTLQPGDSLAVRFRDPSQVVEAGRDGRVREHCSLQERRATGPLTIYDCLGAFSESEILDEHNPWYCPMCCQNQCATKTLTVWRYPDFLIVYLKRFVFHECFSTKLDNKLIFPISGLDMSQFLSGPCSPSSLEYNLYACVCHYGGASAGHYTSYAKHPVSSEWHSFNDDLVCAQQPQEEDYSNAYILFYQRAGTKCNLNIPEKPWLPDLPSTSECTALVPYIVKPNIDQLLQQLDSSAGNFQEGDEQQMSDSVANWCRE